MEVHALTFAVLKPGVSDVAVAVGIKLVPPLVLEQLTVLISAKHH